MASSLEDQLKRLKYEYEEQLQRLEIPDPNGEKCFENLALRSVITMGNIFEEFNTDYIGKYKDQKAYLYFNSGFVGSVFIYEPKLKQSRNIVSLYSEVMSKYAIHEQKQLWIVVKKIDENRSNTLSVWCSCMAGSFETWNHVIATLYKIEYAHKTGGVILYVLTLHVSETKEPERKLNRNAFLTYLLGRNLEASM